MREWIVLFEKNKRSIVFFYNSCLSVEKQSKHRSSTRCKSQTFCYFSWSSLLGPFRVLQASIQRFFYPKLRKIEKAEIPSPFFKQLLQSFPFRLQCILADLLNYRTGLTFYRLQACLSPQEFIIRIRVPSRFFFSVARPPKNEIVFKFDL